MNKEEELIGLLFPGGEFLYVDDIEWDLLNTDDFYRITNKTTWEDLEELAKTYDISELVDHLKTV